MAGMIVATASASEANSVIVADHAGGEAPASQRPAPCPSTSTTTARTYRPVSRRGLATLGSVDVDQVLPCCAEGLLRRDGDQGAGLDGPGLRAAVYCYHEIVHNQRVVERFRDLGVVFVDDMAEVPPGAR